MSATPEALEADIERQRAQLADTVQDLHDRLDVKARAREKAQDLKDRATTDGGRPRPEVVAAGAGVLAGVVALQVHRHRKHGREHT